MILGWGLLAASTAIVLGGHMQKLCFGLWRVFFSSFFHNQGPKAYNGACSLAKPPSSSDFKL